MTNITVRMIQSNRKAKGSDYVGGEWNDARLDNVALSRCTIRDADLKAATIKSSKFHRCRFERVYMRGATFDRTDLTGTHFVECDLHRAKFTTCTLWYVTFDRCQLNYESVLDNLPPEPNLRKHLLRNLRLNAVAMGDGATAHALLLDELRAERDECFAIAFGKTDYYRKKYHGYDRLRYLLRGTSNVIQAIVWGYGIRLDSLLAVALALVVAYAVLEMGFGRYRQESADATLGFMGAIYYSVTTFCTLGCGEIVPANGCARAFAGLEGFTGVLFLGFFAAAVYRRFSR